MQRTIEPTEFAINLSVRNGERDFHNYDIEHWAREAYMVYHREDSSRTYMVDLEDASCQCEAYAKMGVCKHLYIVGKHLQIVEQEQQYDLLWEAQADEYANPEYRSY